MRVVVPAVQFLQDHPAVHTKMPEIRNAHDAIEARLRTTSENKEILEEFDGLDADDC